MTKKLKIFKLLLLSLGSDWYQGGKPTKRGGDITCTSSACIPLHMGWTPHKRGDTCT